MTNTVVNILGKKYHIEDLYDIAHKNRLFGKDELEFIGQETEYICDNITVRPYTVYEWEFIRRSELAGDVKVKVMVRHYTDTDTLGFYYIDNPQEAVTHIKKKKKQFRRKDYKFRFDLGGLCIGYNMDWITNGDGKFPNEEEEFELAYDVFRGRKERLNVGEYFTMEIFGQQLLAYRNEDGVFTK